MTTVSDVDTALQDVIGDRVLAGIQMIDISRLSAHPIPLISGGLITVAGQGPKDSNGAGKSSFIAAISLLSADEQWRLASGASAAAELLFTAEIAAQDGRWSNVDRGYIVGVFTDPAAQGADGWSASALSVWLRINRKAPYIDLRWRPGLHVPAGPSETERVAHADALWAQMDRRNGRNDLHANRLAESLYGPNVRCVSFLSTSVRASPTANLLAQPLNELTSFRIFDAIATLTGLDRELEQEQALRSKEFLERRKVSEARDELARWEKQMAVVTEGIERRTTARTQLQHSLTLWKHHTAQHVLKGHEERLSIEARTAELKLAWERLDQDLRERRRRRESLHDEGFDRRCADAESQWDLLQNQDQTLAARHQAHNEKVEDLQRKHGEMRDQAREADGRDKGTATEEKQHAEALLTKATELVGAAKHAREHAAELLAEAEAGQALGAAQLRQLDGIPAASLLDIVTLDETERDAWERRLVPYREAVVVAAEQAEEAFNRLTELPGSMLVVAGPAPAGFQVPGSADPRLDVGRFLAALADRDNGRTTDEAAGVMIIGGFDSPTTGRVARVAIARADLARAESDLEKAHADAGVARRHRDLTDRRLRGAMAAEQLVTLTTQIESMRRDAVKAAEDREALLPSLIAARKAYINLSAAKQNRQEEFKRLNATITQLTGQQQQNEIDRAQLVDRSLRIELDERLRCWGATLDDASRHVLALDEAEQRRSADDWARDACDELTAVIDSCFGPADEDHIPREVREHVHARTWHRGTPEHRRGVFPNLNRAVRTYLTQTEQQDSHEQAQIESQRSGRRGDLGAAGDGLREASAAAEAHRSSLSDGIRARLKRVADEFDRLDREHGGHGATLEYPEPEPPSEPDKPWRWRVVPKWRRAEGQRHSPYNLRGNTALMDEKAVKLVCAAALAGGSNRPLLLILDELGRNLGKQHRREAVSLFEQIGRSRNITVIGALQDDMERYAIDASGLYIKLRRGSDAQAYNDAPAVVGHDANSDRVAALQGWLNAFRPDTAAVPASDGDLTMDGF